MDYKRATQRFISTGLDLNHPVDLMPEGKYPFLHNMRSYQEGRLETRPGMTNINGSATSDLVINSGMRLNDYLANNFLRFLGIGTKLYTGQTSFTQLDTGFSGNPISFVPYLPLRSPNDFVYLADANKMRKVNVSGTEYAMGIKPPITIPGAELAQPLYTTPASFDVNSPFNTASWGNSGHSTTPALNTGGTRLQGSGQPATTIGSILYISGSTGWACISAVGGGIVSSVDFGPSAIVAGMRLTVGSEYATVEEVHKVYMTPGNTIGQIIYDSGTSGLCTIQATNNMAGVSRNAMILLNSSEFVRVISVTNGPNGISSFRCSTSGTQVAGNAISAPGTGNFWIYLTGAHSAGETLDQPVQVFQINPGVKGGQGSVYTNAGSTPFTLAIAGGRPLTPDDYINISMWIDHPEYLSECNLLLDVDPATTVTHTTADGTKNAYSLTFRGSNFQQYVSNQQTSDAERASAIQLDLQTLTNVPLASPKANPAPIGSGQNSTPVDVATTADSNPPLPILGSATNQLYTGFSQWTELKFKVSDFLPIGMSKTADLSAIKAIILNWTVTNDINVKMAGMWAGGTYGPDSGNNLAPFIYRYRYRASTIGAMSLPGPAVRSGVTAYRQGVVLTAVTSTDPQVDKIDFERLGGPNLSWNYLGTCPNSAPTLLDDQLSAAIALNSPLETDTYQPFTLSGAPQIGLQATVSGTAVSLTSGTVSTDLSIGTAVLINGVETTLYAKPTSATLFHITDSLGFGTSINVDILEPILANQPLPVMWGPFNECLLGVGNALDSGSMYFTKPQDPDSASDANRISVTSPSEMLMNGCVFDTKAFVWSDMGMFQIIPTPGQANLFQTDRINNSKGLVSRWGLALGPAIWFVSHDGVYVTQGGEPQEISIDIQLLFPRGDRPAQAVNGINPIDLTKLITLTYLDSYLYMDYTDSTGVQHTLICDVLTNAWYYDTYFLTTARSINTHYVESSVANGKEIKNLVACGTDGFIYQPGGNTDAGVSILYEFRTPSLNFGDPRAFKILGDAVFDIDPASTTLTATPWINNYSQSLTGTTITNPSRFVTPPFNFALDQFAQNIGFEFNGTASSTGSVKFYFWEPSYLIRPENTTDRATDWDDDGYKGAKFLQGFLIEADTQGSFKTVQLEIDYQVVQTFVVNQNGQLWVPYTLAQAHIGHLFRLIPTDIHPWRLFSVRWVWEPAPELALRWETQETTHDLPGWQYLKDVYIAHQSTADITMTILVDGQTFTATIPNSGGLYKKTYLILPMLANGQTLKGKAFKYILESPAPFRLFQKDCEVLVHSWYGGDYMSKQPFGDITRVSGARI